MRDRFFSRTFLAVTGLIAAAVYLSGQAATRDDPLLTVLASTVAIAAAVGFVVLARLVVMAERCRVSR